MIYFLSYNENLVCRKYVFPTSEARSNECVYVVMFFTFIHLGLFPTFRLFLLYVAVEWKILELLKMIVKFVVSM